MTITCIAGGKGSSGQGAAKPIFSTGAGDYNLVTVTRPANVTLDKIAVQAADDFFVNEDITIQGAPPYLPRMSFKAYVPSV